MANQLLQVGLYKRNQGRIARQLTFAAMAIVVVIGCWRLSLAMSGNVQLMYGVPGVVAIVGVWLSYRVVNMPRFADFLISVEAEMLKVKWPSRDELFRASMVVLATVIIMAACLFLFDLLWIWVFQNLGVRLE